MNSLAIGNLTLFCLAEVVPSPSESRSKVCSRVKSLSFMSMHFFHSCGTFSPDNFLMHRKVCTK